MIDQFSWRSEGEVSGREREGPEEGEEDEGE
jgi:hypothetical protein